MDLIMKESKTKKVSYNFDPDNIEGLVMAMNDIIE